LRLQVAIGLLLAAYWGSTIFVHRPASGYNTIWDGWIYTIAESSPIVPLLLCARRWRRLRWGWVAMAAGIALYTAGDLVWTFHDQNLNPIPAPAPSDALYLSAYAAFIFGVTLLTQGAFGRVHASVRIDGAISGLAIASLAGLLWFTPLLRASGHPLQVAVDIAYPVGDLVLIVLLVAGLAPVRYRPNWSTALLLMGATWFVVGDIVYLNQSTAGTYTPGTPLDATWITGMFFYGLAASARDRRGARAVQTSDRSVLRMNVVPVASGLVSLAVITASIDLHRSAVVAFFALASIFLVIVRIWTESASNYEEARTDDLTRLPNRRLFLEHVQSKLYEGGTDPTGIILIDLDDFKRINDTLGHGAGDELLCIIGRRLENRLGTRGTLARLGGDEFACAARVTNEQGLVSIARDLTAALTEPFVIEGVTVRVSASVGVTISSDKASTAGELLRSADVAMYEAKRTQSGVSAYRAGRDDNSRDQLVITADLPEAIHAQDFLMYYQPLLDMHTSRVRGVEALIRWQHPELGLLSPDRFLPIAERAGLGPQITRVVLEKALADGAQLHLRGHNLHIRVNISRFDVIDTRLPDEIERRLAFYRFPHDHLTLEISESALPSDFELAEHRVDELRTMGLRVSIDDFGTGYSSMSRLLSQSIDEIKIDRSFVFQMCSDRRAQAIVRASIELARALDVTVVAEGIESEEVFRSLQCVGTDIGQGNYISKPLTVAQLDEFVSRPNDANSLGEARVTTRA